ncbi:MAG: GGDEF domain-containing protein [Elusimicrobia bacterium]|nr:GGDEF domain-containing protein [Elusimicrobiota bacterium]
MPPAIYYDPRQNIKSEEKPYGFIKSLFFVLLYALPIAHFFLYIGDPVVIGNKTQTGLAIYGPAFRPFLNFIYVLSGILETPIRVLYYAFFSDTKYFPYMASSTILSSAIEVVKGKAFLGFLLHQLEYGFFYRYLAGAFTWFPIFTIIFIRVIHNLIEKIYDFIRTKLSKISEKFSIIKQRETAYQKALNKRQDALNRMHQDYRDLSIEARDLQTSLITDDLTNIYNKKHFLKTIASEFEYSRRNQKHLSLIMADIDHFKKLNDTYGHVIGDYVLKAVAAALKAETPPNGHCCRFGGEEFAIILPSKTHKEALEITEQMLVKIPQMRFDNYPDIVVTSSFGLVSINFAAPDSQKIEDYESLLHIADTELYNSKLKGRNQINFSKIPW